MMSEPESRQLALDLEAPERTPCRMCQGRGWVSRAPLGWALCTWCEGASSVDPEPEEPVEEWLVVETRVYRVAAHGEADAIAAVSPDQAPVYHTTEAEPVEARRPAAHSPVLRVVG
jgi:hypothetical protein